jgi:hypothetical protein
MSPLGLAIPPRCLADMGHSRPNWTVRVRFPPVSDRTANIAGRPFRAKSRLRKAATFDTVWRFSGHHTIHTSAVQT